MFHSNNRKIILVIEIFGISFLVQYISLGLVSENQEESAILCVKEIYFYEKIPDKNAENSVSELLKFSIFCTGGEGWVGHAFRSSGGLRTYFVSSMTKAWLRPCYLFLSFSAMFKLSEHTNR